MPRAGSTLVLLDSSGLKVYGEGEWKRKIHGASYRRKWRKLHIAIDLVSGDIVASELTKSNFHDVRAVMPLLDQVKGSFKTVLRESENSCFPNSPRFPKNVIFQTPHPDRDGSFSKTKFS